MLFDNYCIIIILGININEITIDMMLVKLYEYFKMGNIISEFF